MFDVEGVGPQGGPESHRFEDLGGKTRVISVGHMGSPEVIEGALATGMAKGAIETWDRLEAFLAEELTDPRQGRASPVGRSGLSIPRSAQAGGIPVTRSVDPRTACRAPSADVPSPLRRGWVTRPGVGATR